MLHDLAEQSSIIPGHGGEGFGTCQIACPNIILHGGDQRDAGSLQQAHRGEVTLPLMGLDVSEVLHARLDSLRHEQRLLLGRLQIGERLAQPFAVPVVTQEIAGPSVSLRKIDGHRGRSEFHRGQGTAALAALSCTRFPCPILSCHHFVTSLVHDAGKRVNFHPKISPNALILNELPPGSPARI